MNRRIWLCVTSLFLCAFFIIGCGQAEKSVAANKKIIANPLNLNYRFQFEEPGRREAADPVLEYFKGKYYLFASKSGGYWSSEDLYEWIFIPSTTIPTENYAPTIIGMNDTLYFMASGRPAIYKTANPDTGQWTRIDTKFEYGTTDPAFYQDEDGKVYIYWGCSDVDPIMGVEVDPRNGFKSIGKPQRLIEHNVEKYGWEVPGNKNDEPRTGWNEGPCMIKYKGKYYLQYAAPGTQYRTYGDGVYIADNPLGPYTYMENSPYSFKPGGFIAGAGHGHTFQDKYGNYWHVASMTIAGRHWFERRLGIFPVYFGDDDNMYAHTVFSDYPFTIPDGKVDFSKNDLSMNWNILSYGKNVEASSSMASFGPGKANDEQIETWWSAATGNEGEWWQVDLGDKMTVNAVHVNFADQDFPVYSRDAGLHYQYYVESSADGKKWERIIDRTANEKDMPHELIVLDMPVKAQYLRITNSRNMNDYGKFSMFDFRVFGTGNGKRPQPVQEFTAERSANDPRRVRFSWDKQDDAKGYIIRWGINASHLNNAVMIYDDNAYEAGFFNRDSEYFFLIDSFNENGVTKGIEVK